MKGSLKILMVFSEIYPFAKTRDVSDVGGSLPKALKEMGHDVRVITPQYRVTNERKYVLRDVIRLQNINVPMGKKTLCVNVKSAFLPNSKVQVYFIDYKPFYFREGIDNNPKSGVAYSDNDKRFILFSKVVLKTLIKLQWQPDVIHCNDWQSGLIPVFLKTVYKEDPFFSKTFSLFTVHDFECQGNFNPNCKSDIAMDQQIEEIDKGIQFNGKCSFLKAGLVYADTISTVSEQYSREVQSNSEYGHGMEEVVKLRKDKLHGVVHGIDTSVWNPESDTLIASNYTLNNLSGKEENKRALLDQYGLPYVENRPVVAIYSRLIREKGLDLVEKVFEEFMRLNISFILLGCGDRSYQRFFDQMGKKYRDRVGVKFKFNDSLFHSLVSGSDIILLPSLVEPCGLTQLYCLKYGTVPVARVTGGLADTIRPFNPETGDGTGFLFQEAKGKHMLRAVKQALKVYENKKFWSRLMKNGMREDFSWHVAAKKYVQLYSKCIQEKK